MDHALGVNVGFQKAFEEISVDIFRSAATVSEENPTFMLRLPTARKTSVGLVKFYLRKVFAGPVFLCTLFLVCGQSSDLRVGWIVWAAFNLHGALGLCIIAIENSLVFAVPMPVSFSPLDDSTSHSSYENTSHHSGPRQQLAAVALSIRLRLPE
eukprot:2133857-Rhodomonas_salina.2